MNNMSTLCPPAAATSRATLPCSCPLISRKSVCAQAALKSALTGGCGGNAGNAGSLDLRIIKLGNFEILNIDNKGFNYRRLFGRFSVRILLFA